METMLVNTYIHDVDQVLDDLAKCQGYDRQIIAFQTKYRDTNQETT